MPYGIIIPTIPYMPSSIPKTRGSGKPAGTEAKGPSPRPGHLPEFAAPTLPLGGRVAILHPPGITNPAVTPVYRGPVSFNTVMTD